MCISAFAVVKEGDACLLGVPRGRRNWIAEWVPAWGAYSKEDLKDAFKQWRLPSGYLREGEHPDDCLRRVVREQLGVRSFKASRPRVFSYSAPSDWYPGNEHWDLVFVYKVKLQGTPKTLPWWRELRFVGRLERGRADFGWNEDMMRDLGLM
jgi:ADP-ribose pyrophosphatase YjhB (NUDIX family)